MTAPIRSVPELFALFQSADPELKKLVWLLAKCSRTSCEMDGDIEVHEDDLRDYLKGKPILAVFYNDDLCGERLVFKAEEG